MRVFLSVGVTCQVPRMRRRNATGDHLKRGIFPFSPLLPNMHLFYALVILRRREKEVSETSIFVPQQATCFYHGHVFFPSSRTHIPVSTSSMWREKRGGGSVPHFPSPDTTSRRGGLRFPFEASSSPGPNMVPREEQAEVAVASFHYYFDPPTHGEKDKKKFDTKMSTVQRVSAPWQQQLILSTSQICPKKSSIYSHA